MMNIATQFYLVIYKWELTPEKCIPQKKDFLRINLCKIKIIMHINGLLNLVNFMKLPVNITQNMLF